MKLKCILLGVVAATFLISNPVWSQGITLPQGASPAAKVSQTIGISTVEVAYSRPFVKGRAIWGELVPFGWNAQAFGNGKEAPWRAGANENTTVEFSHPVKFAGQNVPAGKYGLFFTINKDDSGEVVLSKDNRSWGSFFYEAENDQLRAKIQLRPIAHTEQLTFDFINITKNSAELVLNWEKKQFPVAVEFDVDNLVIANAEAELKGPIGFGWQGFSTAANYAFKNKVATEKAQKWAETAVQRNKNFNTLNTQAGLLRQLGKVAEADKITAEAITMASEIELNAHGYALIGDKKFDEAVRIMLLNTERHPESANAWDSLGEAYFEKGDKSESIKAFKKSLSLNPPQNVRTNSEAFLKKLGAM